MSRQRLVVAALCVAVGRWAAAAPACDVLWPAKGAAAARTVLLRLHPCPRVAAADLSAYLVPETESGEPQPVTGVFSHFSHGSCLVHLRGWPRGLSGRHLVCVDVVHEGKTLSFRTERALRMSAQAIDVALLVDDSYSMRRTDPERLRVKAAGLFADVAAARGDVASLSVIGFSYRAELLLDATAPGDRAALDRALGSLEARGRTDMDAAMSLAHRVLQRSSAPRKVVVVLSDGRDEPGRYLGTHRVFANRRWPVYTVGLSELADRDSLMAVAEDTGGEFFFAPDAGELERIFREIALSIHHTARVADWDLAQGMERGVPVDESMIAVTFSLSRGGAHSVMILSPDGRLRERLGPRPGDRQTQFYAPEPGEWIVKDAGDGQGRVVVAAATDLELVPFPVDPRVDRDGTIQLAALLVRGSRAAGGGRCRVTMRGPEGETQALLTDDGTRGDGVAGDGICGGGAAMRAGGPHAVRFVATGRTAGGWAFERTASIAFDAPVSVSPAIATVAAGPALRRPVPSTPGPSATPVRATTPVPQTRVAAAQIVPPAQQEARAATGAAGPVEAPWPVALPADGPAKPALAATEVEEDDVPAAPVPSPTATREEVTSPAPEVSTAKWPTWLWWLVVLLVAVLLLLLLLYAMRRLRVHPLTKYMLISGAVHAIAFLLVMNVLVGSGVVELERISPSLAVKIHAVEDSLGFAITPRGRAVDLPEQRQAVGVDRRRVPASEDVARAAERPVDDALDRAPDVPSVLPETRPVDVVDAAAKREGEHAALPETAAQERKREEHTPAPESPEPLTSKPAELAARREMRARVAELASRNAADVGELPRKQGASRVALLADDAALAKAAANQVSPQRSSDKPAEAPKKEARPESRVTPAAEVRVVRTRPRAATAPARGSSEPPIASAGFAGALRVVTKALSAGAVRGSEAARAKRAGAEAAVPADRPRVVPGKRAERRRADAPGLLAVARAEGGKVTGIPAATKSHTAPAPSGANAAALHDVVGLLQADAVESSGAAVERHASGVAAPDTFLDAELPLAKSVGAAARSEGPRPPAAALAVAAGVGTAPSENPRGASPTAPEDRGGAATGVQAVRYASARPTVGPTAVEHGVAKHAAVAVSPGVQAAAPAAKAVAASARADVRSGSAVGRAETTGGAVGATRVGAPGEPGVGQPSSGAVPGAAEARPRTRVIAGGATPRKGGAAPAADVWNGSAVSANAAKRVVGRGREDGPNALRVGAAGVASSERRDEVGHADEAPQVASIPARAVELGPDGLSGRPDADVRVTSEGARAGGRGTALICLARYKGGDWDCSPTAMLFLAHQLEERTGMAIEATDRIVDLSSRELMGAPFVYMTGHRDFTFTDAEVRNLRTYLAAGGYLWADDSTHFGDETFDRAFRREIARVLPGGELAALPMDYEAFRTGYDLTQGYRGYAIPPGDKYRLDYIEGVRIGERVAVVYTRNDYGDGLNIDPNTHPLKVSLTDLSPAEMQEGAVRMGVNLALHFLTAGGRGTALAASARGGLRAGSDDTRPSVPAGTVRVLDPLASIEPWSVETWGDSATVRVRGGRLDLAFTRGAREKAALTRSFTPALRLTPRETLVIGAESYLRCGSRLAIGFFSGDRYWESAPFFLKPGSNTAVFDMAARTFKCEASDWQYNASPGAGLSVDRLTVLIYAPVGGRVALDELRVVERR